MYTKNMKLHKGVDNRLQFQFLNQDQKVVDITGKTITFRLIKYDGSKILLEKTLTPILPLTGITEIQIFASELMDIDAQKCHYSLEVPVDSFNMPVFVDDYSSGRGVIEVLDSIYPSFIPSKSVTIPTHRLPKDCCDIFTFDSSVIKSNDACQTTLQLFFKAFTGTVQLQGSTLPDADWYNIGEAKTYTLQDASELFTPEGHHPYLRFNITEYSAGDITKMLYR
jgi:hypothetical protein